jgi:hypothetical protein
MGRRARKEKKGSIGETLKDLAAEALETAAGAATAVVVTRAAQAIEAAQPVEHDQEPERPSGARSRKSGKRSARIANHRKSSQKRTSIRRKPSSKSDKRVGKELPKRRGFERSRNGAINNARPDLRVLPVGVHRVQRYSGTPSANFG